ncbi:MAG: YfcE family phosphodiesterase [Candidatus Coproplasma sp.]
MKTVVVLSDTHGNRAAMEKLYPVMGESDYVIHLGDTSGDGNLLRKKFGDKVYLLNGNCDPFKLGEDELVLEIEGVKVLACHGHAYGVKRGLDRLAYRAEEVEAQVALYGHTHDAREDAMGKISLFNPGTLSRYSRNTYLYLVVNGDKFTGKIVDLF